MKGVQFVEFQKEYWSRVKFFAFLPVHLLLEVLLQQDRVHLLLMAPFRNIKLGSRLSCHFWRNLFGKFWSERTCFFWLGKGFGISSQRCENFGFGLWTKHFVRFKHFSSSFKLADLNLNARTPSTRCYYDLFCSLMQAAQCSSCSLCCRFHAGIFQECFSAGSLGKAFHDF